MLRSDTFVSVDIETTGLKADLHEIIEIGAVKVDKGVITAEYSELVKPDKPVPGHITRLTGIAEKDLHNAGDIRQVLPSFLDFVSGYRVLGQNVGFDVAFLRAAAGMGNFGSPLDTCELARILLPMLPSYSLDSLMEFFSLECENRHRALDDARVTAQIFLKLTEMLRMVPDSLLNEMTAIAGRTGSSLRDIFEAHLLERMNETAPARLKKLSPPAAAKIDNMYGDFSGDEPVTEPESSSVDPQFVASLLRKGGRMSQIYDAYEERSGQIDMAMKITCAFNDSEIMLAEAGTGTGKSIAYLLPAVLFAETARDRVVVSTNTKNLQEQLFYKDIPLLGAILDFPFRVVILKGRGNYICLNRWQRLVETPEQYLTKAERALVLPVAAWLHTTVTGDISETGFFQMLYETGLLDRINSDSAFCLGAQCQFRDRCFVSRIRKAAQRAHLIIVNHSLVFSDMVSDGGVLGGYSRIVFDEAHNLEKQAIRFLGVSFTYYRIRRILNRLHTKSEGRGHGALAVISSWIGEIVKGWPEFETYIPLIDAAIEAAQLTRSRSQEFFERMNASVQAAVSQNESLHEGKLRYYPESPVFALNSDAVEDFAGALTILIEAAEQVFNFITGVSSNRLKQKEDILIDFEKTKEDLQAVVNDLQFLSAASGKNVFWFEYGENGSYYSLKIQSAPLDVAEKLAAGLYDHMETVIMTSATLAVANDFSYIRDRLGLNLDQRERVTEFIASSPFDYDRQAAVVIPSFLPSPKAEDFIERTNEVLLELAREVGRGMLVLFTSRGHLQRSFNELRDPFARYGVTLLAQGVEGSRSHILRRFQDDVHSVLFGTDSFWEGVDVPGESLEVVVMVRLPFAVPTEPIVQAQMEEIEKAGKNPFLEFSVPEAAIKLRQGAGRLIRRRNDKGAVIILDNRITTTRYGATFKRSLPGRTMRADSLPMLVQNLKQWFNDEKDIPKPKEKDCLK